MRQAQTFLDKAWKKNWQGRWNVLGCNYLALQYARQLKEVLGVSLKEALIISHKGISACYFIDENKRQFGDYFAKQALAQPDLVEFWAKSLVEVTDEVLSTLSELRLLEASKDNFERFIEAKYKYGVYHRIVKVAVDYLPKEILETHLEAWSAARVYAEPVYEEAENYMQYMAQRISQTMEVPAELVLAMNKDQFEEYLNTGQMPHTEILRSQYENTVLYVAENDWQMVSGSAVAGIEQAIEGAKNLSEIKGQTAFGGKAVGRVRIIVDATKENEFNDGDILVTGMTRPEYLQYVSRSAGFVTDAGGILSHAAITARELKKPCVIGTENATKILQQGELIEVDADRGVIKRLEV